MGTFYLKRPNAKKRKCKCRVCGKHIMWTVSVLGHNMPVEYDDKLEHLFDGIVKVYFDSSTMRAHFPNCPANKLYR